MPRFRRSAAALTTASALVTGLAAAVPSAAGAEPAPAPSDARVYPQQGHVVLDPGTVRTLAALPAGEMASQFKNVVFAVGGPSTTVAFLAVAEHVLADGVHRAAAEGRGIDVDWQVLPDGNVAVTV